MKLLITDRRKRLLRSERELVQRRIQYAVSRYNTAVESLQIVFSDQNGPKGGADLHCQLKARIRGGETVVVSHQDVDVPQAISTAADRMQRTLARRLERRRD